MADQLTFEIREAIVEACGSAFWLKDPLCSLLRTAEVPTGLLARYRQESKYKMVRHVLDELDLLGDRGFLIQRRILTELCKLRNLPDRTVPDRDAALMALRRLKEAAEAQKLYVEAHQDETRTAKRVANNSQELKLARNRKVEELLGEFRSMASSSEDPQTRGYGLEELLRALFEAHEIAYRPPYRTGLEQIDGHFSFQAFDYLVEARWRQKAPTEADLTAFKRKVDKKIASTRGVFVSIVGFRSEVIDEFARSTTSNLILVDGADLALILEGQISLTDALELKIQKAAQEGQAYFSLARRFD